MSGPPSLGEFGLIARDYAPLAGEGARGLTDDVAEMDGLVLTTDTVACGVHFLPGDPLDTVARKAVRVNVSDLVAKGCRPRAMTLAVAWGRDADEADHAAFAAGLGRDLEAYGLSLLGGDTTRLAGGPGPVVTVTMLGRPIGERVPSRAGARAGDAVFVTGTIGDGFLGLRALRAGAADDPSVRAYRLPDPPVALAPTIARYATASLDVSDGLMADAGHLAAASGLSVRLDAAAVPLSEPGRAFAAQHGIVPLVTGGDDYQALFTVPAAAADGLAEAGGRLTRIGTCEAGEAGAVLIGGDAREVAVTRAGYSHF